jgi:type VI secretion system protein ImpB
MSSEASVAPKERVNIRYRPATGDAKEDVELPHKLLVLDDFTGRTDDTPVAERKRIDVTKDSFNDVMRSQGLALELKVPNRLAEGEDAGELPVNLKIGNLKDFEPEQVARQIPELNALLELRRALTALKGPVGNMPAFRKALERILADPAMREKVLAEIGAGETADKAAG